MNDSAFRAPFLAELSPSTARGNLARIGRWFFATAIVASGIQQIVTAEFVRLVPKLSAWIPWPAFWAYGVGLILIFLGIHLAEGNKTREAAFGFGFLLLLCLFFRHLPIAASDPLRGYLWTNPLKILALCGGVLVLALDGRAEKVGWLGRFFRKRKKANHLAAIFLGLFLLVGGIQHFVYADFVKTLVPSYIPGGSLFWTYFSGVALISGGVGLVLPKTARLAGLLSGVMIFLWVFLLHLPRALADLGNAGETSAIFEALALSGVAFLVASSTRWPVPPIETTSPIAK